MKVQKLPGEANPNLNEERYYKNSGRVLSVSKTDAEIKVWIEFCRFEFTAQGISSDKSELKTSVTPKRVSENQFSQTALNVLGHIYLLQQ